MNSITRHLLVSIGLLLLMLILSHCEPGRPLNREADIISFVILDENGNELANVKDVNSNAIHVAIPDNVNIKKLKIIFTISSGANIFPNPNMYQDFSNPVEYVVASEDGMWKQKYTIAVEILSWKFNFENWTSYQGVPNFNPSGWTSGNIGSYTLNNILNENNQIEYPTYKSSDAYSGNAAVGITTRQGAQNLFVPPIIAGSVFIGNFNTKQLMNDPIECPEFGRNFNYTGNNKPSSLKAYYKYQPGLIYTDENSNILPEKIDKCSIQAILFYGETPLHVRDLNNSPRIIAHAYFETDETVKDFNLLELPFLYLQEIPTDKQLQLSISVTSSKEGDFYRGAVGSTLILDDVEVVFENNKL